MLVVLVVVLVLSSQHESSSSIRDHSEGRLSWCLSALLGSEVEVDQHNLEKSDMSADVHREADESP
jgi:hypothetical protein